MTDTQLEDAMAAIADAAHLVLEAIDLPHDPQTTLCILGAATSMALRQLPFHERIPEACRWAEALIEATELGNRMRQH